MQDSILKSFWQQGRKKGREGGAADRNGGGGLRGKMKVSETLNANHNQMGKLV